MPNDHSCELLIAVHEIGEPHLDRLVGLVHRQLRPIVGGKARAAVEFGAKISISVGNGFAFLHRLGWDAYNDGEDLIAQADNYKQINGFYLERICAYRIYINAKNRRFWARAGFCFLGKQLGTQP